MKPGNIRIPAVAGQFYEASPPRLEAELSAKFADCGEIAEKFRDKHARALISPHAGYVYSGMTAAKVFSSSAGASYRRAVVVAPSHRVPFTGLAAASYSAYATPLGNFNIDSDAVGKILESPVVSMLDSAHEEEHALEVQLPFLKKLYPDIPIVPFICGRLDDKTAELAAEALKHLWHPENLWIISSDFTHYGYSFGYVPFTDNVPENLRNLDLGAVEKITALDPDAFSDYVEKTGATICGANPVKLLLKVIENAGDTEKITAELIDYTTSGELTGDYSHCVSYAGITFFDREYSS